MAFPVVESTSGSFLSPGTSTESLSMPPGVVAGNALLLLLDCNSTTPWATPLGWTALHSTVTSNSKHYQTFARIASGSGDAPSIDRTANGGAAVYQIYRLSGTANGTLADLAAACTAAGFDEGGNPPSLTTGFGAVDTLWIASSNAQGGPTGVTPPSSYVSTLSTDSSGWFDSTHSARRQLAAASEDPGQWVFSSGRPLFPVGRTIAVRGTAATDTTPPSLSSPSGTGGLGVCSGSVSTNEGNGTLFAVATASTTQPSVAQIKAGQDHTGAAALRAVSQAVTATGTQTIASGAISGGAGTRYWHFVHTDTAANDSARVSSAGFEVTATATQLVLSVPDAAGLSGFNGIVLSAAAPGSGVTVIATPTGISFNGSGQATINVTGLGIPVGQRRWVSVTNSTGDPAQSPTPVQAQGPVTAS